MERFSARLSDELLSSEIFDTLAEVRYLIDGWRLIHNHRRIQRALGKVTPAAFAVTCTQGATTVQQLSEGVDR